MWEEKEKEKEEKEKKFLHADKRKVVQACKFAEKEPELVQIGRNFALSMQKSTSPPVLAVLTNISYESDLAQYTCKD